MSQQFSTVTGSNFDFNVARFEDLFDLDGICTEAKLPTEKPSEPPCPPTEKVVVPAPVMPKPARAATVKPVIEKPMFGCDGLRAIMASEARKRSTNMSTDEACIAACGFALRIVMFDYREASNYEELLEQVRIAAIEAHQGDEQKAKAWYAEAKRELKKQREAKQATKPAEGFTSAAIVEPAPGLEPMVGLGVLWQQLMLAKPADIEQVARHIVGTLKGDDRYAKHADARQKLLDETRTKVIAVLVLAGVSLEEALRRGESVKNAWPLRPKKAAPTKATTAGPARPLTADELKAMFGGKDEVVEKAAESVSERGTERTVDEISRYHNEIAQRVAEKAARKEAMAKVEAKAAEDAAAKAAAEALAAEQAKEAKAKAAADAKAKEEAKAEAKRNKGKHAR